MNKTLQPKELKITKSKSFLLAKNSKQMGSFKAKPFLKWPGGKTQLLEQFYNYFPEELWNGKIHTYIEPFVGSGALLFHILQEFPITHAYINDISKELVLIYRVIQSKPEELIEELLKIQKEYLPKNELQRKEFFLKVRDEFNFNKSIVEKKDLHESWLKRAAQSIFLNRTCYNGLFRFNKKGDFNSPFGNYVNPKICNTENIQNVSALLKKVEISQGDFEKVKNQLDEKCFVYLDPPYRPISKTSNFTSYSSDGFGDTEHIRLSSFLNYIHSQGAKFMLSNSEPKNENPEDTFLDELYTGKVNDILFLDHGKTYFDEFYINHVYASRMINSKGDKRGKIKELIVTNYKPEKRNENEARN